MQTAVQGDFRFPQMGTTIFGVKTSYTEQMEAMIKADSYKRFSSIEQNEGVVDDEGLLYLVAWDGT